MTILTFPITPSTQAVRATVYRLGTTFPGWLIELDESEDGRPSVSAQHRATGGVLSAHWDHRGWAVLNEDMDVVTRSADLSVAISSAIA
jgi:hypothetical protein